MFLRAEKTSYQEIITDVIDDWEVIGDKESFLMTRDLLTYEGIYAGGSSGGAVRAAIKYAEKLKNLKKSSSFCQTLGIDMHLKSLMTIG